MAMSYTELTGEKSDSGSIRSWINNSKIDVENVLIEAQALIYQTLRVRQMRSAETVTVGVGDESASLPTGFLSHISFRNVTDDCEIEPKDAAELEKLRSWSSGTLDSGDPAYYAVFDEAIQFECKASTAFTGRMLFYKLPTFLSTSNETNFLTTRYPHLLRPAVMAMAAVYFKDMETYTREMQRLSALITGANSMGDLDDYAGQNLTFTGP